MALEAILKRLNEAFCSPQRQDQPSVDRRIETATAAVLLDIAHADQKLTPTEETHLLAHLQRQFALPEPVARDLVAAGDEMRRTTIDHWSLTDFIRRNSSLEERIEIVRTMWRVVYADDFLSDHEEYLVKKLANLLGLEQHVMIEAKLLVRAELGLA